MPPVQWEAERVPPSAFAGATSVVSLLSVFLRYRALIVVLGVLSAFYAGYQSFTQPHYYITTASFMPQGSRGQSQLSGLAQQFGLSAGDYSGNTYPFYMDLMESRTLLTYVGSRQYTLHTDTGDVTGDIIKLYGIDAKNPAVRKAQMVTALRSQLEKSPNQRTGVINIKVRARTPEMAFQIARNLLDEVNKFNLNRRQAEAGAQRSFVEKRLGEAQIELRQAEENLESFLIENREFRASPSLQLEYDRLNRAVSMRQQVYTGLQQSFEQAKIEEVKDLPVITVIEQPEMPIAPEPHGTVRKTLMGGLVGLGIGIVIAFGIHLVTLMTRHQESDDYLEFADLSRETMNDLTHPWRIFTRPFTARARPA